MSHILIVGQKFSSLTNYLLDNGHEYTFFQDENKTKFPNKKFKRRVLADFSTRESVLASLNKVKRPIDGVISVYENYVLPAAWIAEHLGIAGIPVRSAEACTDKTLMRKLFAQAPEQISPAFREVTTKLELLEFAHSHSFPLILKPANLSKSLLVTRNDTEEELIRNYDKALNLLGSTYKKYAPNRTPKLIIEEFLEGSIHSVDAFVDHHGTPHILNQIVDYRTGYDIGYDDNFHYSRLLPSALSTVDQYALRHCAEVGIRSLGMKSSPAHVEIIMTKNGPRIVEIGARNGGYRERMHWLANGIDIIGAAVDLTIGHVPTLKAERNEPCAVLELFPKQPGRFDGIHNIDSLKSLKSLEYLSVKPKAGDSIGKSSDGYKMSLIIILHNSDEAAFAADLTFVDQHVYVRTSA